MEKNFSHVSEVVEGGSEAKHDVTPNSQSKFVYKIRRGKYQIKF